MKKVRTLLAAAMMLCLALFLAGCSEPIEEEEGGSQSYSDGSAGSMNCVIVYSRHANSQASAEGMEQYVRGAKEANGYLGFVRLDGSPVAVCGEQTATEHNNETRIKKENDEFVDAKMAELEEIKAVAGEVDVLGALKEAGKCFEQAADNSLDNVVVIVGTGLSTTGVVNFAEHSLDTLDLADYEAWIERSGQLPDLSGIDKIVWYGFDSVEAPQAKFTTDELEESLKSFYVTLLTAAGVGNVEFKSSIASVEAASDLPSVSVVQMPERPMYGVGDVAEVSADVLFNPDEATFLDGADPSQNEDVIAVANSIKTNKLSVTITGYTAHYGTQSHGGVEALSLARADALKDVLVGMGCPADSITTVGGGWGPYDSDQANRCVQFKFE